MKKPFVLLLVLTFCLCLTVTGLAADGETSFDPLGFIKGIFIPRDGYFESKTVALNDLVNEKFGGLGYLYQILNTFFQTLRDGAPDVPLTFSLPSGYLYAGSPGGSYDFLTSARPYLNFLHALLTSALYLFTAVTCYHKVRTMLEGGGAG